VNSNLPKNNKKESKRQKNIISAKSKKIVRMSGEETVFNLSGYYFHPMAALSLPISSLIEKHVCFFFQPEKIAMKVSRTYSTPASYAPRLLYFLPFPFPYTSYKDILYCTAPHHYFSIPIE